MDRVARSNPFGLAVEAADPSTKYPDLHLAKSDTLLLTYFNGRADFELAVTAGQHVLAIYQQCDARAENCHWMSQAWSPESADAKVKIYPLFTSSPAPR